MEIHDYWRGTSYEESPLQTDPSAKYALHRATPSLADGHTATEQAPRAVGVTELPAAVYIQELFYFRTMV